MLGTAEHYIAESASRQPRSETAMAGQPYNASPVLSAAVNERRRHSDSPECHNGLKAHEW